MIVPQSANNNRCSIMSSIMDGVFSRVCSCGGSAYSSWNDQVFSFFIMLLFYPRDKVKYLDCSH